MCRASTRYFCGCITAPALCTSYTPASWSTEPCNTKLPLIFETTTCGRSNCEKSYPLAPRLVSKTDGNNRPHSPGGCHRCKCTVTSPAKKSGSSAQPAGTRNSMIVKNAQIKADGKLAESIATEEGYYECIVEMTKAEFSSESKGRSSSVRHDEPSSSSSRSHHHEPSSSARHHESSSSSRPSSSRRHESESSHRHESSSSSGPSSSRRHESSENHRRGSDSRRHESSSHHNKPSSSSRQPSPQRQKSSKSSWFKFSSSSRNDSHEKEASKLSKSSKGPASLVSSASPRNPPQSSHHSGSGSVASSRHPLTRSKSHKKLPEDTAAAGKDRLDSRHSHRQPSSAQEENEPEVIGLDRCPENKYLPRLEAGKFQEDLDSVVAQLEQMEFDRLTREEATSIDNFVGHCEDDDDDNESWTHRIAGKNAVRRLTVEPAVSHGASRHVTVVQHGTDYRSDIHSMAGEMVSGEDSDDYDESSSLPQKAKNIFRMNRGGGEGMHDHRRRRSSYSSESSYGSYGPEDFPEMFPQPLYVAGHIAYDSDRDDRRRHTHHGGRPHHSRSKSHGDTHRHRRSTRYDDNHHEERRRQERRRSRSWRRDTHGRDHNSRDHKSHDHKSREKNTHRSKLTREKSTRHSSRRDDDKHRKSKSHSKSHIQGHSQGHSKNHSKSHSKTSDNKGLASFLSNIFGKSHKHSGKSSSNSKSSKAPKYRSDGYFSSRSHRSSRHFHSRRASPNASDASFGCVDSNLISNGHQPSARVYSHMRRTPEAPVYINGTDSVVYEQENSTGMYPQRGYRNGPDVAGNNWI